MIAPGVGWRVRLVDDELVAARGRSVKRLPLGQVSAIRFRSSPWDFGTVTLHSPGIEIELPWRRRSLRREVGCRLRAYGKVPFTGDHRHAWGWLFQKV